MGNRSRVFLPFVVLTVIGGCADESGGGGGGAGGSSGLGGATGGALATGGLATTGGQGEAGGTGGALGTTGGGGTTTGGASVGGSATGGAATGGAATGATGGAETGGAATGGSAGVNGWRLVWADEFDGTAIDGSKWEHEVNCWGGGNGEDQCYVNAAKNSFVGGGALHIVALADSPSGAVGGPGNDPTIVTKGHSSARLRTLHRGDFKYGRIEARIQLPYGQGLWPAFWMLPTDSVYGGWAASGEIDIMEAVNLAPGANLVHGTLHYGGAWPANVHTGDSYGPAQNVWEGSHVYAVEWEEGEVRWFFDETHFETQSDWYSTAAAYPAPFDEQFHIILNVAVGGAWPGPPDGTTSFPQEMVVDYVRVYECELDPVTGHGCGSSDPGVQPL